MQFSAILTSLALAGCAVSTFAAPAHAQGRDAARESARTDDTILDMAQAYKQRDRKRLAALLPQVRSHPLEPWAAYWELSARLDDASNTDIQDFLYRYSGTYQEDRLRAELRAASEKARKAHACIYALRRLRKLYWNDAVPEQRIADLQTVEAKNVTTIKFTERDFRDGLLRDGVIRLSR